MLVDLLPVDHIEERLDVFRPPVLVFQVVGMFPYIQAEQRSFALAQGIVLIGCGDNVQPAVVCHKPGPTAAEQQSGRVWKFAFKRFEITEGLFDSIGNFPAKSNVFFQNRPEKRMIGMAAAVIPHGRSDFFGYFVQAFDQVLGTAFF